MLATRLIRVGCGLLVVIAGGLVFLAAGCKVELPKFPDDDMPNIMCVEEPDGKYYVCYFDESKHKLVRWKGVRLTEEQLPTVYGPWFNVQSTVHIYERPTWLRRLRGLPEMHYFTPPRRRVTVEADPPIYYGVEGKTGNLELFFFLRGEHYVIKEVKSPKLKKGIQLKFLLWELERIIRIDVPAHRVKEVEKILSELLEANPVSPPN